MNKALHRARNGAALVGAILVVSPLAFHWITKKPLLESVYWTVITITGVGYSQDVDTTIGPARQLLSISVILVGMLAVAYTLGMMIQAIVEGQLDLAMGARRMNKDIQNQKGHVIICGFGRIGQTLSHRLVQHGISFVVIDPSQEALDEARDHNYLLVEGDAASEEILLEAGLACASTIVIALPSDAENVFITLTARNLNPDVTILARGEHPHTEKKLLQAGANHIVLPAVSGAERMAEIIVTPVPTSPPPSVESAVEDDAELEEIRVEADSTLIGSNVREVECQTQLMIVVLKRADGQILLNPDGGVEFSVGDSVIVMGSIEHIEALGNRSLAQQPEVAAV